MLPITAWAGFTKLAGAFYTPQRQLEEQKIQQALRGKAFNLGRRTNLPQAFPLQQNGGHNQPRRRQFGHARPELRTRRHAFAPPRRNSDGRASRTVDAGSKLVLEPGMSITLLPGQYHEFWAEPGSGRCCSVKYLQSTTTILTTGLRAPWPLPE